MAGLIGYEMKKLFSRRIVPFLLLALFVFNGLMVYRESGKSVGYGYTREDVGRVYDSLEGMTALEAEEFLSGRIRLLEAVDVWRQWADGQDTWNEEEKAGFLNSNRELMEAYPDLDIDAGYLLYLDNFRMEQWLLEDVLEQVSAAAHYGEYLDGIGEEARIMTSSSLFGKPGTFAYRNIEKTPPVYEHLKGNVLPAEDSGGVVLATRSRVTDVLLLCFIVILGLSMVIGERGEGTLLLIKPTKKGYLETITAKLLVLLLSTAAATVIFYLTDYLVAQAALGLGDLSRQLQSVDGFLTSPYEITVGQYLAGFLTVKTAAALVWGALVFFLCTMFKNAVSACLAMGAVFLVQFVLYLSISLHSYLSPLKILNLVCLADTSWFFADYLNMNLFGWPVNVVPVCAGLGLLVFGLSSFFALRRFVRESSALGAENRLVTAVKRILRRRRGKGRAVRVGLFAKELYKIFVMERAWLLLLLFALLQWNSYREIPFYGNPYDQYYYSYVIKAEGLPLEEAAAVYQEEYDWFEEKERELERISDAFDAGEASYAQFEAVRMENSMLSDARSGFQMALSQYEYVLNQNRAGNEAEVFYQTGWQNLFDIYGRREDVTNVAKLSFFLLLGLAAVFSIEKDTKVEMLQKSYIRGGGSVCLRKYLSCLIYGTAAYLIAYLPRYLAVFKAYGVHGLTAHLKSLSELADVPFNVPLWAYLVLVGAARYVGMLAAMGLILWLSRRCGSMIHTILLGALLLELPAFLYLMGLTGETYLSLLPMMTGADMFRLTAGRLLYWGVVLALGLWFYFQTYEEGGAA